MKEDSGAKLGKSVLKVKGNNGANQKKSAAVVPSVELKGRRRNGFNRDEKKEKKGKTKFEEFLERDMKKDALLNADADLELERRLAKKLKVKAGKLGGFDNGMADILDGLGEGDVFLDPTKDTRSKKADASHINDSGLDSEEEGEEDYMIQMDGSGSGLDEGLGEEGEDEADDSDEEEDKGKGDDPDKEGEDDVEASDDSKDALPVDGKNHKEEKEMTEKSKQKGDDATDIYGRKKVDQAVKYVPPHLRGKASDVSEETIRIQRRLRGLLNRLSEANVESIASDVSLLFQAHGRQMVTKLMTDEIIGACCGGPRGND